MAKKQFDNNKKKNSLFKTWFQWPLIVLFLSFFLSMIFGIISELALNNASIVISIIVILVFVILSILTDMIGVAIVACDIQPFMAMASKKVKGAKQAIKLIKNADRVASIIADILGDICGILSGAAGASVTIALTYESMSPFVAIVIASLVSAIIAALIISGKALMKRYSMVHAEKIILILGKILAIFWFEKKSKKQNNKKNLSQEENVEDESVKLDEDNNQTDNQESKIDIIDK